jgi:phosphate transport system substrate-binding protein
MNDEFLHALRREPPPEFARELKRRLQRQPAPRINRSWAIRTLLAMFLIGGVAMAALLMRKEDGPPRDAAPVAQVVAPETPAPASEPAGAAQPEHQGARGARTASEPQPTEAAAEDPRSTFATSALARPIAQALVDSLRGFGPSTPRVSVMDENEAFLALCDQIDFVMVSRRITEAELTRCWNQHIEVAEWKLGYQAVVLTAAPMADYAALRQPRDVFLALARRIPDPAEPSRLIDNPNMTWRDVDARFDSRSIDVLVPTDATTRAAFARLVMEPGCATFRWIRELKQSNPQRFEDICHQLRSDERLHEVELRNLLITQQLWAEPNWLVVLDYSFYARRRADLLGTMLEGPAPTLATFTDGTYSAARPVYVYAKRARIVSSPVNRTLVYALSDGYSFGARGAMALSGLISVDEAPRPNQGVPPMPPPALQSLKPEGAPK